MAYVPLKYHVATSVDNQLKECQCAIFSLFSSDEKQPLAISIEKLHRSVIYNNSGSEMRRVLRCFKNISKELDTKNKLPRCRMNPSIASIPFKGGILCSERR